MGDVDGRRAYPVVQIAQLLGHRLAELGVERAERLVHQEGLGPAHDGAAERDALPVAARETGDLARQEVLDAQEPRRLAHLLGAFRSRDTPWHFSGKPMFASTFMCG